MRRRLLAWYEENRRDLPWRRTRDPYRIWISEIMLQQTRVAAVIPYYERFLERFPNVAALANAREHDVLTAWAGLGYYSRARNLQRAAKKIQELGAFPRDHLSLKSLAGIGEYTAAAVASIAFNLPHPVLDGNAIRVLSRLTAEQGNIDSTPARKRLRDAAELLLDPKRPGEFNQALMELGATVCLPKQPECSACPLTQHCEARLRGLQQELPLRSRRAKPVRVEKHLLAIERRGKILLWQRTADSARLAGFWELPEVGQIHGARVEDRVGQFKHTIVNTNYSVEIYRGFIGAQPKGFRWVKHTSVHEMPLSTTTKKALACLAKQVRNENEN